MAKFSIKRFGRKCGNSFSDILAPFIKGIGLAIWLVLISIIAIIWGAIKWLLFWNPICFLICSRIAPRKMAKKLYFKAKPDEDDTWKGVFAMMRVCRAYLCGWQRHILPMKSKRWFVLEKQESFKCAVRIEAYRSFMFDGMKPEADDLLSKMSEDTRKFFEEESYATTNERKALLAIKENYTQDDVWFMLANKVNCDLIDRIYRKNTPSQEYVDILLRACKLSYNEFCGDLLMKCIWRDGVSAKTILGINQIGYADIRDKLMRLATIRGEVQLVKMLASWGSAGKQEWSKFLSDMPELFAESEKEMSVSMMELFYKSEHHLHEENVLYFLSGVGGSTSTVEAYRKLVLANEDLKQPALDYIKSNAEVYRLYLQIKA